MEDTFLQTFPFKNKPFVHQKAYLQRFWREPVAALFADTGTGKSFMLINKLPPCSMTGASINAL
jgi:hypothetical protein